VLKPLSKTQRDLVEAYRQGFGPRAAAALSQDELCHAALLAAAHVDAEIARMQRAGALKSVNKSYRTYRLEAASRGERVLPYGVWMARYKAGLVREVATNLR
jgi:hypothetical protein